LTTYAWANPETSVREQADTLEEARLRAWTELQQLVGATPAVIIYRQEPAGQVGPDSSVLHNVTPWAAVQRDRDEGQSPAWADGYAWASPVDALRFTSETFQGAVETIRRQDPDFDRTKTIIIYRQHEAARVSKSDPQPPTPPTPPSPIEESQIDSMIQLLLSREDPQDYEISRAGALGQLWAAKALREILDTLRLPPLCFTPTQFLRPAPPEPTPALTLNPKTHIPILPTLNPTHIPIPAQTEPSISDPNATLYHLPEHTYRPNEMYRSKPCVLCGWQEDHSIHKPPFETTRIEVESGDEYTVRTGRIRKEPESADNPFPDVARPATKDEVNRARIRLHGVKRTRMAEELKSLINQQATDNDPASRNIRGEQIRRVWGRWNRQIDEEFIDRVQKRETDPTGI